MNKDTINKVVLVTGASRGIGAATAKLLAKRGYSVAINYVKNADAATDVANEIKQNGGMCDTFCADVTNENAVTRLFDNIEANLGKVNYLVNNAGILFTQSTLSDISLERFLKTVNGNLTSTFLCAKEFIKRCPSDGAIVNVSSGASQSGAPFEYVDYAAAKGAVDSLTRGLALEVAERGIRVNAIRPGLIYTDIHSDGGEPTRVDRLKEKIPLKRGGQPTEVANSIAYLLSDDASFITGKILDVTGGI
ncbi:SDR family oxidoreductase [Pseudoalteromonas spongiae]|uniref:SDR family oxidoreductase n=1 Tax=Pseudoalteromonas spongiae TaxID=298657 RepID=UPI003736491E